jgi:hypothetical protein
MKKTKIKTEHRITFEEIGRKGLERASVSQTFVVHKKEYEKVYNSVSKLEKEKENRA